MARLSIAARDLTPGDIIRMKTDSLLVGEVLRRGPSSLTIRARSRDLDGCPMVERTYMNGKVFAVDRDGAQ